MSARAKPHPYEPNIMLETSALVAGYGANPSDEDLARRPAVVRLVQEATGYGSTIQVATASHLELCWKGVPPAILSGLELLAFDARAARALARLSTLPEIAQSTKGKKLVKFDSMVLASAVWRSDLVVTYDPLFAKLLAAFSRARRESAEYLPQRFPRAVTAEELLPKQEPIRGAGFPAGEAAVPEPGKIGSSTA